MTNAFLSDIVPLRFFRQSVEYLRPLTVLYSLLSLHWGK